MEAVYYAARANLRRLMRLHPQWTHQQYAQAVGMSRGWVKKWKQRLQEAEPADEQVLHSRSRARRHPPERISQAVIDAEICQIEKNVSHSGVLPIEHANIPVIQKIPTQQVIMTGPVRRRVF